jgi:hypothetical protein
VKSHDFEFVCTHRILTTEYFWFDLEEYKRGQDTFLLVHLRFSKWSPQAFKQTRKVWTAFRQCVTAPIFALGETDDEKWARFVSLLGFRFHTQVNCLNGCTRRLFIHVVQDGHAL